MSNYKGAAAGTVGIPCLMSEKWGGGVAGCRDRVEWGLMHHRSWSHGNPLGTYRLTDTHDWKHHFAATFWQSVIMGPQKAKTKSKIRRILFIVLLGLWITFKHDLFFHLCSFLLFFLGQLGNSETRNIQCSEVHSGRFLSIYLDHDGILTLCEVQVFGCKWSIWAPEFEFWNLSISIFHKFHQAFHVLHS